jgi:hypothetical protein
MSESEYRERWATIERYKKMWLALPSDGKDRLDGIVVIWLTGAIRDRGEATEADLTEAINHWNRFCSDRYRTGGGYSW